MRIISFVFLSLCLYIASPFAQAGMNTAPDSTNPGPHAVASGEYRLPAAVDSDVLADRAVEIWAKVFYPGDISNMQGKAPLVIMLHGNHSTCGVMNGNVRSDNSCEYTDTGACPAGSIVTPNHEGYDYLAKNLASWGYWVVSINTNRGINCGYGDEQDYGLITARGRMVLKHLSLLYKWSTEGGAPGSIGADMMNKIDFSKVGLFGHSRGGGGVRAAYNLYQDSASGWQEKIPGLQIRAIFELGATDSPVGSMYEKPARFYNATGTVWNQLLPMCDGDVSDLQGRFPYERMLLDSSEPMDAQKSLYEVWGANHNFFNTEWQQTDNYDCPNNFMIFDPRDSGSEKQQKIALASVPAFFRSHLGEQQDQVYNRNFNPLSDLPAVVTDITRIDRDFTPSPGADEMALVEDFSKATGTNASGNQNAAGQIEIKHSKLDPKWKRTKTRMATISWQTAGAQAYFEAVWTAAGSGRDISQFATLDFRVARADSELNANDSTDFDIQLEDAAGRLSNPVAVSNYALISGPGSLTHSGDTEEEAEKGVYNKVFQTVRIPLTAFNSVDMAKIHGVKLVFDKTASGALYLANIRVMRDLGVGMSGTSAALGGVRPALKAFAALKPAAVTYVPVNKNSIKIIQRVPVTAALAKHRAGVEITLRSEVPFPAMDSIPVLRIGEQQFYVSRYTDSRHLQEMTFTLSEEQFASLQKDQDIYLHDGKVWKFGTMATWLGKNTVH